MNIDSNTIIFLLLIISLVVLLSSFFSMVEVAILTTPMAKIQAEADKGRTSAITLLKLREKLEDTIATIVIVNTVVNIGGSFIVGFLTQERLGEHAIIGKYVIPALVVVAIVVFGEVLPKVIGESHNASIAFKAAEIVNALRRILALPIAILSSLSSSFRRKDIPLTSEGDIIDLVNLGGKSGAIEDHEREIIQKIFRLKDATAKKIMTHRVHMSALEESTKVLDLTGEELSDLHSRIIIYDKDLDHITGIVLKNDILVAHAKGKEILTLKEISKPHHTVYEEITAHQLLELFKKTRQHLFIVVDSEGGTSGVVTLEDVLEEIVGDIHDESDDLNEEEIKEEEKEERLSELNLIGPTPQDENNKKESDSSMESRSKTNLVDSHSN